jgi:UDP:flavonoid glycosyltransferase YjiC (YdhE family)
MASQKPRATADMALEALRRAGQRGVLYAGWGGLHKEDLPDDVYMIGSTPHSWLFPRMAAVVHHGGAGTTGAGLAAGIPSVVTPFFADQPFWAQRVYELGAGPKPIPRRRLTTENLAASIEAAVADGALRERAAPLGAHIRAEDGVAAAIALIEKSVRK